MSRSRRKKVAFRSVWATLALALLLVALPATAAAGYSPELKRYPYLTDVVGDSATVNWGTTRFSITGVLKYGQVGTESCTAHTVTPTKTAITVGATAEYQWKARLSGLAPDTEYCYRLYIGTAQIDLLGDDSSPEFRTQLPAGSNEPFSFAVFGDWGEVHPDGTNPEQANLMRQIASSGARFALTTGDNAYPSGSQANYGDLTQTGADTSGVFAPQYWTVAGASMSLFPALGNHGFSGGTSHLLNWPQDSAVAGSGGRYVKETYCCESGTTSGQYPSAWYAFDAGDARFYVLEAAWTETNVGTASAYEVDYRYHWTPTSEQYRWLQNDLATHPRALKFAFTHYPFYSDNASEGANPFLQGPNGLEGLLSRYGVDMSFSGHAHTYQRNNASGTNGLVNYLTGGGGAHLQPVGQNGCSPIDAYGIGWSYSANGGLGGGSACGAAPTPTDVAQVHHFLRVSVNGSAVTVTPTDSLGRAFDEATYPRTTANADLSLSQTESAEPALLGQTLTFSLTARNDGPSDAHGAVVTDNLPAGVDYESATASQGSCSEAGGVVACSLGGIASGASATVDVKVKPRNLGSITNQATVVGDDMTDPSIANNASSEETTVVPAADLSLAVSDSPDPVLVGQTLTYTLTARNDGPSDATGVSLSDNLPAGVSYLSATPSQGSCSEAGGTVSCALGDIASGGNAAVRIALQAGEPATVTNAASIRGDQRDPSSANNSVSENTTIRGSANLSLSMTDSPDPVFVGQALTYTLTIRNAGPTATGGVTVTDTLPPSIPYQSASPSQGSCLQVIGRVTCSLGRLASGATATITIVVRPDKPGNLTNSASAQGTEPDPNAANNAATATTKAKKK